MKDVIVWGTALFLVILWIVFAKGLTFGQRCNMYMGDEFDKCVKGLAESDKID